jgi:N-acyl-D-amino-acid deacylase
MPTSAPPASDSLDILITGGRVVDGTGLPWFGADVGISAGRIAAVGSLAGAAARTRIDAAGKVVAPGFIDAHVHGDLTLLVDPYHEPAIRQGVTTYLVGQDGVAFAPGSPDTLEYMRRYTAGFSGGHRVERTWDGVAGYLGQFDRRCALNVATLVPNGNVRMDVMGLATRPPTADELVRMRRLVREGMEQGAVGLSSGLDYIPSRYAEEAELAALCEEVAPFGGVYVTHMRSYRPEGIEAATDEVYRIGRRAGCAVHISHFNGRATQVIPKIDRGRADGIDVTYDLYPYLAGSSILAAVALPPWVQEGGIDVTLGRLRDPDTRQKLREWFAAPRVPLESVRLSAVPAERYHHHEGRTLAEAARTDGRELGEFVCELLLACGMAAGCVAPHVRRDESDVRALTAHPAMMAGSDGIYVGGRPHPRGTGAFARYLGPYVRDGVWTLEQAVSHLSYHAARRFGLTDRGLVRPGMAADVVVFDPDTVADRSTYEDGKTLAAGVEQVVVNGELVLHDGKRTAALPGRGLKRGG